MPRPRKDANKVTLQLADLFKMLEIEQTPEVERLAQTLLNFLVYMKPGDRLSTPWCAFEKCGTDLIYLTVARQKAMTAAAADALDAKAIIHLPT